MGRLHVSPDRAFVVAYGAAHGAKSLIWHASELMFAFVLTEAAGLPASHVGLILALSLLVNAALDLTLGWTIRRRVTSSRAAARLQLIGALVSGATLVVFSTVGYLPETARFGFALASILAFRCAYPLLDNPQNAMLAFATGDDGGRARIASLRYLVGGGASLALAAVFAPMMIGVEAGVRSQRFFWLCLALAALVVGASAILDLQVRRHPGVRITRAVGVTCRPAATMGSGYVQAIAVFAMAFTLSASLSVFARLNPYFTAFGVRDVSEAGLILSATAIGSLVSQFGWSRLAQSWSLIAVLRVAVVTSAAGAVLFYFGVGLGSAATAACVAVYGIGTGGVMMSMWSLLARVASSEGSRLQGTAAFGVYTCCSKIGLAASAGAVGLILAGLDYRVQSVAVGPVAVWMAGAPVLGLLVVGLLTTLMPGRARSAQDAVSPPVAPSAR